MDGISRELWIDAASGREVSLQYLLLAYIDSECNEGVMTGECAVRQPLIGACELR